MPYPYAFELKNFINFSEQSFNLYIDETSKIILNNERNFDSDLIAIIALAFLGGATLNFMSCVLPIISLKILAFSKDTANNSSRRKAAISLVLGIIFSFMLLAFLTIIVKISGGKLGLGLNFQVPKFIICLAVIITIFISIAQGNAVIPLSSKINYLANMPINNKYLANFWSGTLLVLLSSSCTAPFLGTTMSFALSSSYIYFSRVSGNCYWF